MNEHRQTEGRPGREHGAHGHGGHGWMMIACCIPMLAIAVLLVAAGVVSPGFLFVAIACTAIMALMMRGMSHTDEVGGSVVTDPPTRGGERA